ncbi:hypothetical protein B0H19DRAFT_1277627 [Mycena capillaripes]|nr:hypothetical protein B0H19DRAFT_1277627 [Mycena capillaripes]
MFSKIFTFGLAALSFVSAAPATGFQGPMAISCSVNVQSVGDTAAAYSLEPGMYRILDVYMNRDLRSYNQDVPIFVPPTRENPGPFAYWNVEARNDGLAISNIGLRNPVYVGDDGTVIAGSQKEPIPFAVEAAGDDTFVIKSVNQNLLWTLKDPRGLRSEACAAPSGNRRNGAEVEIH